MSEVASRGGRVPRRGPDPASGVEANAHLTAVTGLLLVGMLFAEGVTVVSIGPLVSWHIGIGLALVPPVGLKLGSTLWRFARYYLGAPRYRRAGPPHPVLRALGPLVVLSTLALLASGVAWWLLGPSAPGPVALGHKAIFVVWFVLMTVHVLAHLTQVTRVARADLTGRRRRLGPGDRPGLRQGLVLASLVGGVALGLAARGLVGAWGHGLPGLR